MSSMDNMKHIEILNDKLGKLNDEYKISSTMNNFEQQLSVRTDTNLHDLIQQNVNESNIINDKMNSFLIDKSIHKTNNDYYNIDNKIPTNTTNYTTENYNTTINESNKESSMHEDINNRLEKLQFHNMTDYIIKNTNYNDDTNINDDNNININDNNMDKGNNLKYNKLSPFDNSNINISMKTNDDLINNRLKNFTPLGRSMISCHNIQHELNENFNNNRHKNKKDEGNERISEFTPLSRACQIPVKHTIVTSDTTRKFLDSENTFSQSNLNTNYKNKK